MSCGLDICYCQSNFIIYNILYCFNTSHVTLYQRKMPKTTLIQNVSIHLMLLFIAWTYWHEGSKSHVSIHLMLLFIIADNFISRVSFDVSIHLMLLFIVFGGETAQQITAFQYISCYSLSKRRSCYSCDLLVSIHLMLLFIW